MPVKNLQSEDFKIFEDGIERKIDFFEPIRKQNENRPLSLVFALDTSGSMTAKELQQLKKALQKFVGRFNDYNSYFAVMTFGMNVKTVQSFTNRADKLEKTFDKILRDQDGLSTHAYDAVDDAVRLLRKKSPPSIGSQIPRKVVILITDGFPVGDTVAPKTVIERANDAETSVYAVLLPSFSRLQNSKKPLLTPLEVSGLIDKTGGKSFYATEKNFDPLFKDLAEEITSSYAIAFYPAEKSIATENFTKSESKRMKNFPSSKIAQATGYNKFYKRKTKFEFKIRRRRRPDRRNRRRFVVVNIEFDRIESDDDQVSSAFVAVYDIALFGIGININFFVTYRADCCRHFFYSPKNFSIYFASLKN